MSLIIRIMVYLHDEDGQLPDLTKNFCSRFSLIGAFILVLGACDGGQQPIRLNDGVMSIPVPEKIREIRALDDDQLEIQVSVNGEVRRTVRVPDSSETVSTVVNIPTEQSNEITVSWFAVVGSTNVLLADFTNVVAAGETVLNVASYNSTGSRFDFDGDGRSNLEEAFDNRNLLSEFDLEVPQQNSFGGTVAFITDDGIDSNTSGDTADPDEDTLFRLRHNGTQLIVYVCGQDRVLVGDNIASDGEYWHDDTVFIYLDGADSDSGVYDQVDDFQLAFVRSTGEMIVSKGAENTFCPNGDCVDHTFFPGNSSCEYELNVTLPLADLNMTIGSAIGFDIEIVDDDNGGLRDASSAWIGFDDRADLDTATFGTIRLN